MGVEEVEGGEVWREDRCREIGLGCCGEKKAW
jgi:hypothetical protein